MSQYEVIEDASGSDLQTNKIKLLLNKQVTKLNVEDHTVTLADGSIIYYNKVLFIHIRFITMVKHIMNIPDLLINCK